MEKKLKSIRSALLVLCASMALSAGALAAPVQYNINFSQTVGSSTQTGSFFYDAAAPAFSNFNVTLNGQSFDFTNAANNANSAACATGSGPTLGFAILSGNTGCRTEQIWSFLHQGSSVVDFFFSSPDAFVADTATMHIGDAFDLFISNATPPATTNNGGRFTITAVTTGAVPEPQSVALFALGMIALAIGRRRRAGR